MECCVAGGSGTTQATYCCSMTLRFAVRMAYDFLRHRYIHMSIPASACSSRIKYSCGRCVSAIYQQNGRYMTFLCFPFTEKLIAGVSTIFTCSLYQSKTCIAWVLLAITFANDNGNSFHIHRHAVFTSSIGSRTFVAVWNDHCHMHPLKKHRVLNSGTFSLRTLENASGQLRVARVQQQQDLHHTDLYRGDARP